MDERQEGEDIVGFTYSSVIVGLVMVCLEVFEVDKIKSKHGLLIGVVV